MTKRTCTNRNESSNSNPTKQQLIGTPPLEQHITLAQAAKFTPGRPSANAMWRWARKGVLTRGGDRLRLKHIRIGGRVFTTTQWVEQFGHALADADRGYFEEKANAGAMAPSRDERFSAPARRRKRRADKPPRVDRDDTTDADLDAEGL